MNILCCTSNEYSPYAGVMLASLFENNKSIKFIVYVFTTGLCPENLERMAMLEKKYGNAICIKNFSEQDLKIKIPMHGNIESLNASVAAGILMYEAVRPQ